MDNKKEPIITNEKKLDVDLSEEYFNESVKPKKGALTFIFMIVATFSFIALGWYVYKINNTIKSVDELEIIQADNNITKVMPEDPGGMVIPDMDKSIYDNLSTSGNEKSAKQEKIIPQPEEPVIPNQELPKKEDLNTNNENSQLIEDNSKITPQIKENENIKIVQKQSSTEVLKKKEKEIKQKLATKKKGVYVQVGSFKTESDASSTWQKLHKKHSHIIGSSYYIERKDLGAKGIFYRLQTGPYKSESEARLVCQKLQSCNQGCFIAR